MAALDWGGRIGKDTPDEEHLKVIDTADELPPVPPPVIDEAIISKDKANLDLEKRIEEFSKADIYIPAPTTLNDYPAQISLSPVLWEGLFRCGRKGMLTADSKAGKSFFAIELAICVSSGTPFLGRKTKKSKVVYFNYEIADDEFMDRIKQVAASLNIDENDFKDNFHVVHMRGYSLSLDAMCGNMIALLLSEQIKTGEPYALVILDPIYKITAGDENSAEAVGRFCNNLDKIAKESGSSVFYTHHHAKGDQAGKKAMDRGSGSGVFARDADLMIDLVELTIDGQTKAALLNNFMCEFWISQLDEFGSDWRHQCTTNEQRSSGSLAALYQSVSGADPSKIMLMAMEQQQRFNDEMEKSTAFRMEFVTRSFERPRPQNLMFRYPIHILDKKGLLVTAQIETHAPGVEKKDTPAAKAQKLDVFVETVDQLILSSEEGYTTYAEVGVALEMEQRTITRRLTALNGRYDVVQGGKGRGDVTKIRFRSDR